MTEAKLVAIVDFETSAHFTSAEKAALTLADEMSNTPADVPRAVSAAVVGHYGDQGLVALASIIAREQYRARFNRALGIQSNDLSDGQYCPLPIRRST